jgi:hypothetical protein
MRTTAPLALALLACSTAPSPHPPAPAPASDDPNSDEVAFSATVPPLLTAEVALIDAGAQPRQTLRYHPRAGQSRPVLVELATALSLAVGEMNPPEVRTPVLRLTIDLDPRAIDASGRMNIEGTLSRVETRPGSAPTAVASALAADVERLRQTRFVARISSRGLIEHLSLPTVAEPSSQLGTVSGWIREALRLLLPPLPDQPVGRGARWQARRRTQIGAASANENAVYTLTGLTDSRLRLAVKLRLSAGEQTPAVPGLPPGATLKLTSLAGSGAGTVDVDLSALQPRTDLRWTATALGSTDRPGDPPAPVRMATTVELAIRPP